jgi:hypothetical protein
LVFGDHKNCTTKCCIYDAAWGPHDSNYISWNKAVCSYPNFVTDDFAETPYISWKAVECTYPYTPNKTGTSEGNKDCLESPPRKIRSKWVVNLQPSKLERDNNNDGAKNETWDDLAEVTFKMYFKSLFDAWDEQLDDENEYDGHEDNEAFQESLS